ncbi:hypothetical protein NLJ89_g11871 [Agrocybe chaxingu]|uniref:DEAD/DEAH-box helicase domain-containing protein n=1 Tax=Agrocybe chaxingu TaxID=84603 RepID=A0A9W8JNJ4_9AGAR|nr:hypothetical protein NLJ89_g11871 [Agrocybe chaxingu]
MHYHIRGAMLYEAYRNLAAFDNDPIRAVEHEALPNLRPGALSPYNACVDYQRFASALALNANTPPTTRVSEDGYHISFREHTLHVPTWRQGMARLEQEVAAELDTLCYGGDFGLSIPDNVPDDWTNETRGYSWLSNASFLPEPRPLLKAMLEDPSLRLATLTSEGKLDMNTAAMWEVLGRCASIVSKLEVLTLTSPGQSPRITEFVEHKIANSTRPRTVFRDRGDLWLATRRTKTENQVSKETFLPIKCHPRLARLLERYLLIVRPLERDLAYCLKGQEAYNLYSEYLWVKNCRLTTADEFYRSFPVFARDYCGVDVGVREYRQLCVEIGRVYLGSEFEVKEEDIDVLSAQMGHSARVAQQHYATEVGHLPSMSSDLLLRYGRISEAWWEVTGFKPNAPPLLPLRSRQRLRETSASTSNDHVCGTSIAAGPSMAAPAFDASSLAAMLTSTIVAEVQKVKLDLRTYVREAVAEALPTQQHIDAPLPHAAYAPPPPPPSHQPASSSAPELPTEQPDDFACHHMDIYGDDTSSTDDKEPETKEYLLTLLRSHFADVDDPQFKSPQQMQAVEEAVSRRRNFVAVLPTGAGKSLTFTLPPFNNEDGYHNYIVIPNKALLVDQLEKARNVGLRCFEWKAASRRHVPDGTQLVLGVRG